MIRSRHIGLVALCCTLSGCGPSAVMLVGQVVNAAGTAVVEQREKEQRERPFEQRRMEAAEELLRYQAEGGDADAQYRLGLLYEMSKQPQAKEWVCRAAIGGHGKAQLQMGHWYSEDRKTVDPWPHIRVSPDDRQAYLWYSLAEASGEPAAALFRGELTRKRMTADHIAQAEAGIGHWQPEEGCGRTALSWTDS